jgi:hypothetical protein
VVLRKQDNQLIEVPIERLSAEDRQFLATAEAASDREPAADGDLAESVKVTAQAAWSPMMMLDEQGKPLPPVLEVSLILQGKGAALASAYGNLEASAQDEQGNELEPKLERMMGFGDGLVAIDRQSEFEKHPKNGVRVPVQLTIEDASIKKLAELKGTLTIKSGGRHEAIMIEGVADKLDQPIEHELLSDAGLEVKIARQAQADTAPSAGAAFGFGFGSEAADTINVSVTGNLGEVIAVTLADASGKSLKTVMSGSAGDDQQMTYSFGLEKELPPAARLQIMLHRDAEEVVVPFEVKNLNVPRKPVDPPGGRFPF